MKSVNVFVPCTGNDVARLEEEYFYMGRYTKRAPGGLSVVALTPPMKKTDSGKWVWVLSKPRKNVPVKRGQDRNDEPREKTRDREQRPKQRS